MLAHSARCANVGHNVKTRWPLTPTNVCQQSIDGSDLRLTSPNGQTDSWHSEAREHLHSHMALMLSAHPPHHRTRIPWLWDDYAPIPSKEKLQCFHSEAHTCQQHYEVAFGPGGQLGLHIVNVSGLSNKPQSSSHFFIKGQVVAARQRRKHQ